MPIKELKVLTAFSVDHTEQESNCNVQSQINALLKILEVSCMKLGRGIFLYENCVLFKNSFCKQQFSLSESSAAF